jgi:multiple sugar transport system substrate-binding protein
MSDRNRRPWIRPASALAALAAVLGSAAACTGDDDGPRPDDGADVTITWYAGSIDQDQNDFRVALIDEFESANPSIDVKLIPGQTNTDVGRASVQEMINGPSAGTSKPDVYLGDVIWPAEFAEKGLARPLDDEFAPDFWRRFTPELLPAVKYRGKTYAVPLYTDQGVLFYRRDLVPKPPGTWESLIAEADRVRRERPETYGYVWQGDVYEGLTCNWTEVLADAGGQTLDDAGTGSALAAHDSKGSQPALRALQFLRSLIDRRTSPPEVASFQEPNGTALFASGQVVFLRGWNGAYARMITSANDEVRGNVGVAALPNFADRPGPPGRGGYSAFGGWNLYLNPHIEPNSRKLAAAKTFIEWMTDVQAQRILARYYRLPVNETVRNDPALRDDQAMAAALRARPVPRPSHVAAYPEVSKAIYSTVNGVLRGESSPSDAIRQADEKINEALR